MSDDKGFAGLAEAMAQTRQAGEVTWDDPLPIGYHARLPVFPAHRFPGWLYEYCVAVAEELQVPVDLPAMLALSVLATAAGGRCVAEVRAGWREPLNLFTATAMPPGTRKTPVFNRLTRPLFAAEADAVEKARPDVAEGRVRWSVAKAQAEKAEADVARASADAQEEAVNFAKQKRLMAEAVTIPIVPRLLADDATPEALTSLLHEQGGRLAMFSDEGEVFSMIAGRYSTSGPNLGVFLKAHVGSPIRVDRKGRDAEFIERPALTLGLTIQPSMLTQVSGIEGARGRGLLGRFLWSVPASNIGTRRSDTEPVPVALEVQFNAHVTTLVSQLAEWTDPAVVVFSPDAALAVRRYQEVLERRMVHGGDLEYIADWAAKLAGHVVRIAGLLHLATNVRTGWSEPVQASVVDDAVMIGDYLIVHALLAFDAMEANRVFTDAKAMVPWLAARSSFTRREIFKAHQRRFGTVAHLEPVLELLQDFSYIRIMLRRETAGRGRPLGPEYTVNPQIRISGESGARP